MPNKDKQRIQKSKADWSKSVSQQQSARVIRPNWMWGMITLFLIVCAGFAATTQNKPTQPVPVQQTTAQIDPEAPVQSVSYDADINRPRSLDDEDVDPRTWRSLDLILTKPDGGTLEMNLLRPLWWIQEVGVEEGKTISLSIPEMGVDGPTKVLSIEHMKPGPPRGAGVITGTFKHSAANVLDLQLEGESKPIGVTYNHPFRSADRNDWIVAGELKKGEQVVTRTGTTKVISLKKRLGQEEVYNLEVHKDHTFFVGETGAWVHNSCVHWDGTNWRKLDGTIGDPPVIKRTPGADATLDKADTIIDGGTVKISSGHGYNRPHTGPGGVVKDLRTTGLSMDEIEMALLKDLSNAIKNSAGPAVGKGPSLRQVTIGGHTIEYRVVQFGTGQYGIGTYYLK